MPEWQAYRNGNTRKDYWAIAGSGILHTTITNERLARRGYYVDTVGRNKKITESVWIVLILYFFIKNNAFL